MASTRAEAVAKQATGSRAILGMTFSLALLVLTPSLHQGRHYRPISGELLWCRSSIAGSLADNARMTAIRPARKRILYGNCIWKRPPYQGSAYSFLVLLIRFYEGGRLTHHTSESGTSRHLVRCNDMSAVRVRPEVIGRSTRMSQLGHG